VTPGGWSANLSRLERVRSEWLDVTRPPVLDVERFDEIKRQADELIKAGKWTSGPSDMLSVLGRQRDELVHSKLIGWLLVPTNRHGLGRALLTALLDALWPGEELLPSGPVVVETEIGGIGLDGDGRLRQARADIIVSGDGLTVVIENKLDAAEQPEQCERLYWAWAAEPGDIRWVFLTPTGRPPVTASSYAARSAWRTMSYSQLHDVIQGVVGQAAASTATGRLTAIQYLTTLSAAVAR
jgi:hypothetical protein